MAEDKMVGGHRPLNGHEFEQALGGDPPSLLPMGAHPTPPAPRELTLPGLAAPVKRTVVGPGQPAG